MPLQQIEEWTHQQNPDRHLQHLRETYVQKDNGNNTPRNEKDCHPLNPTQQKKSCHTAASSRNPILAFLLEFGFLPRPVFWQHEIVFASHRFLPDRLETYASTNPAASTLATVSIC
jgi:hypothetical protein